MNLLSSSLEVINPKVTMLELFFFLEAPGISPPSCPFQLLHTVFLGFKDCSIVSLSLSLPLSSVSIITFPLLSLTLLFPSSKKTSNYTRPTQIVQDNLHISPSHGSGFSDEAVDETEGLFFCHRDHFQDFISHLQ